MTGRRICFFGLLLIQASACTTLTAPSSVAPETVMPVKSAQSNIKKLHAWNIQGAIAINAPQKGANASFAWLQQYRHYTVNIFGPLGTNHILLEGDDQFALLKTPNIVRRSRNAETLLQEHLGWYIPVNNLYYWIRGLPAMGEKHAMYNAQGQLVALDQQGWHVEYKMYGQFDGLDVPMLIELQHVGLAIRIVIHQWS
jgi:outer membrane lipoprotein LolB